jgi:hypothetical protein
VSGFGGVLAGLTYFMGGGVDAIYDDMNPTGMARFAPTRPACPDPVSWSTANESRSSVDTRGSVAGGRFGSV